MKTGKSRGDKKIGKQMKQKLFDSELKYENY